MLENYYITGKNIDLRKYNLGILHQPTIDELLERNTTNFDIVNPFIAIERMYTNSNFLENGLDIRCKFDLSYALDFMMQDVNILENILKTLTIIYQLDNIEDIKFIRPSDITPAAFLIEQKEVVINEDNFDMLMDILLEMFYINKNEILDNDSEEEWVEQTGTEEEKRIIEYFKNKNRKKKEKEAFDIADYINIICHINGFIPYKDVLDLTFYQLMNSYYNVLQIRQYEEELKYRCSFKYDFKEPQEPLLKTIKISKSSVI